MQVVKEYPDDYKLQMVLSDNGLFVAFEILGEDGEVEIDGDVKWDGCINWQTNPDCMFHFCEPMHVDALADKLRDLWPEAKRLMPKAIF